MESMSNTNETSGMQHAAQPTSMSSMSDMSSMGTMMGSMQGGMCEMGGSNHLSIGMKAPDFTAKTTFGTMKMSDYKGKWLVFFSHPGDFTPVAKA